MLGDFFFMCIMWSGKFAFLVKLREVCFNVTAVLDNVYC